MFFDFFLANRKIFENFCKHFAIQPPAFWWRSRSQHWELSDLVYSFYLWHRMVLHDIVWYGMVLHDIVWYCMVLCGIALYSLALQNFVDIVWYCNILGAVRLGLLLLFVNSVASPSSSKQSFSAAGVSTPFIITMSALWWWLFQKGLLTDLEVSRLNVSRRIDKMQFCVWIIIKLIPLKRNFNISFSLESVQIVRQGLSMWGSASICQSKCWLPPLPTLAKASWRQTKQQSRLLFLTAVGGKFHRFVSYDDGFPNWSIFTTSFLYLDQLWSRSLLLSGFGKVLKHFHCHKWPWVNTFN